MSIKSKTFTAFEDYEQHNLINKANKWINDNNLEIININRYKEKQEIHRGYSSKSYFVYYLTVYGKTKTNTNEELSNIIIEKDKEIKLLKEELNKRNNI